MNDYNNIALWLIGSNASGKTTQAKLLHSQLGFSSKEVHNGIEEGVVWKCTTFGKSVANVGIVGDNQCTGCDTLQGKDSIRLSYEKALTKSSLVIIDGIMATGTWIEWLKKPKVKVITVLLNYNTLEDNLSRLSERRSKKLGILPSEVEFSDKTKKNVFGKIRGFRSMLNRVSNKSDLAIEIDAMLKIDEINKKILDSILSLQ